MKIKVNKEYCKMYNKYNVSIGDKIADLEIGREYVVYALEYCAMNGDFEFYVYTNSIVKRIASIENNFRE